MRSRPIPYSDAELRWIEKNKLLSRRDMASRFAEKFDRQDVTENHLKGLCTRKGWSAGTAGRSRNKGKSTIFTPDQIEWLKDHATLSRADTHVQFCKAFPDAGITLKQIIAFRKNRKIKSGRTGYFEKGHVPWSKGRKIPYNANRAATQFKKGETPSNYIGPGHERIDSQDGYVVMIVDEKNPWSGASTRPVHKHRYLWEQENGPVPDDHVLKCLDGDKTNCEPSNWELIPRGLLPRLNGIAGRGYDKAPDEIKPTIMATAKLAHKLNDLQKDES